MRALVESFRLGHASMMDREHATERLPLAGIASARSHLGNDRSTVVAKVSATRGLAVDPMVRLW